MDGVEQHRGSRTHCITLAGGRREGITLELEPCLNELCQRRIRADMTSATLRYLRQQLSEGSLSLLLGTPEGATDVPIAAGQRIAARGDAKLPCVSARPLPERATSPAGCSCIHGSDATRPRLTYGTFMGRA